MAARRKKPPPPRVDPEFDRRVMAAALRLGRRNLGHTASNPAVGCVVVAGEGNGGATVVGRGWTAVGGRPHAEKVALKEAGAKARGATAYVTLEPCAHEGRTKSCTRTLIEAGVGRVVTAMTDPDPRTDGKGHAALAEAGIMVTTGVLAEAAALAHAGHVARITKGRPHVALKLAISADGMIGRRVGERMIITGKPAFDAVQATRTTFDVVMIGIGTVLVDDPRLTVRLPGLTDRSPARVILDAEVRLPLDSKLVQSARQTPLFAAVGPDAPPERKSALAAAGVTLIEVGAGSGGLDLDAVLGALCGRGFTRVLVEGGAQVAASLIAGDLVGEVILLRAPVVVGADGVRALAGMALSAIERSPRYCLIETVRVGDDQMRRYVRAG
ncbi:MAG: bifunctional diaminohydroxyphosphoribosylaminopyrimidine deaminase/5-amino-6-(5-phosphoribosylamino)uracil reductase RibD [Bauldia sp.]